MTRSREQVVLLHGIWCNHWVLKPLARRLAACGYEPHSFRYASVQSAPADNAARLNAFVQQLPSADAVHFVAHSLGGFVVLHLFQQYPDQPPGRIVTLATPFTGSRRAERLLRVPWLGRRLLGASVRRGALGGAPAIPGDREVGALVGSVGVGLGLFLGPLGEPGDGVVAVSETRAAGLRDHRVLRTSHSGLLLSAEAAGEICHFLAHGRFRDASPAGK